MFLVKKKHWPVALEQVEELAHTVLEQVGELVCFVLEVAMASLQTAVVMELFVGGKVVVRPPLAMIGSLVPMRSRTPARCQNAVSGLWRVLS